MTLLRSRRLKYIVQQTRRYGQIEVTFNINSKLIILKKREI